MTLKALLVAAAAAACLAITTGHAQFTDTVAEGLTYSIANADVNGVNDAVSFEVTVNIDTWVAFGLGDPDSGGMVSPRTRVLVLDSDDGVHIYGLLSKGESAANQPLIATLDLANLPVGIHSVSIDRSGGLTKLVFTASSIDGETIIKSGNERFVAAHGLAGDRIFKKHNSINRATIAVDLSVPTTTPSKSPTLTPPTKSPSQVLTNSPSTTSGSPTVSSSSPTKTPSTSPTTASPSSVPPTKAPTGSASIVSLSSDVQIEHESVVLSDGQSVGVRVTVTSNHNAWVALGLSSTGGMVGSTAVVYRPGATPDNQVKIFLLTNKSVDTLDGYESSGDLTDSTVAKAAGVDAVSVSFIDNVAVMTFDLETLGDVALVSSTEQTHKFVIAHGVDGDTGASGGSRHGGYFQNEFTFEAQVAPGQDPSETTVSIPGETGVDVTYKTVSVDDTDAVAFTVEFDGAAWLGFGLASTGEKTMIGSTVVIYKPDDNDVKLGVWSLPGRSSSDFELVRNLTDSVQAQEAGFSDISFGISEDSTTMSFTTSSFADWPVIGTESRNNFIAAVGKTRTFDGARHEVRGDEVLRFGLVGEPPLAESESPVAAPTPAPVATSTSQTHELRGQDWVVSAVSGAAFDSVPATANVEMVLKLERWVAAGISGGGSNEMVGGRVVVYEPEADTVQMMDFPSTSQSSFLILGDLKDAAKAQELGVSNLVASQIDGVTTLSFDATEFQGMPLIGDADGGTGRMIFAHGKSNSFTQHADDARLPRTISFVAGGDTIGPDKKELTPRLAAHVTLMVLSWGIMIPAGITSAMIRHLGFCTKGGKWFKIHQYVNSFGVLLGTIGAVIGIALVSENNVAFDSSNHFPIGVIVTVLGLVQAVIGYARPHVANAGEKKPMSRVVFEIGHRVNGLIVFVLAQINILLGAALLVKRNPGDGVLMTNTLSYVEFESIAKLVVAIAFICVFGSMAAGLVHKVMYGTHEVSGKPSAIGDSEADLLQGQRRPDAGEIQMNGNQNNPGAENMTVVVQN